MTGFATSKNRLLYMYARLAEGKLLYKQETAQLFGCSLRSIQRDIDDLRTFFHEQNERDGLTQDIIYDRTLGAYVLTPPLRNLLNNEEVFAVLKILLESRAFTKQELKPILDKLIDCCVPKTEQQRVCELIGNERLHYVEPQHKDKFLKKMWALGEAIYQQYEVVIKYRRNDGEVITRTLQPVSIMFSEFYFYLACFIVPEEREKLEFRIKDDPFPTIYRIDRIIDYKITEKHFAIPYAKRFQEGEFRKRVQFMFGGRLQKLRFYFHGASPEYVLDRLPTARILEEDEHGLLMEAEVFGGGIDFWLKSQGETIEVISRTALPVIC